MTTTQMTALGLLRAVCVAGLYLGAVFALIDEWIDHKENPRYRISHYWRMMPRHGRVRRYDTRKDDER